MSIWKGNMGFSTVGFLATRVHYFQTNPYGCSPSEMESHCFPFFSHEYPNRSPSRNQEISLNHTKHGLVSSWNKFFFHSFSRLGKLQDRMDEEKEPEKATSDKAGRVGCTVTSATKMWWSVKKTNWWCRTDVTKWFYQQGYTINQLVTFLSLIGRIISLYSHHYN
jgi:hypothetical protein